MRGVIIGERLPKSGLEIIITVLEGEEDNPWGNEEARVGEQKSQAGGWGMMSVLSGCITIASAALADAGIDCVDLICGGMAAIVHQPALLNTNQRQTQPSGKKTGSNTNLEVVLDPCPIEHREITAACVVGYLQSRDEITEIWVKGGDLRPSSKQNSGRFTIDLLMDRAVEASMATRLVLVAAINESTELKLKI